MDEYISFIFIRMINYRERKHAFIKVCASINLKTKTRYEKKI